MANIQTVILAAGKGTRIKSKQPKVLIQIKNKPIISRLLDCLERASVCDKPLVVVDASCRGKTIKRCLGDRCCYAIQKNPLGTAHAVLSAKKHLMGFNNILILAGDHPYIHPLTLKNLIKNHQNQKAIITVLAFRVPHFNGIYKIFFTSGRIVTNGSNIVEKIVELKEANKKEQRVRLINTAIYCFRTDWLWKNIHKIKNQNLKKEFYLTDLVALALKQKRKTTMLCTNSILDAMGVNTPEQLDIAKSFF